MYRWLRVLLSLLVFSASPLGSNSPATATNYTTVASGVWDSDTGAGGVWSPDGTPPYYPVSGDQVTFNNQTITVNSPQSFGGPGTASTISNTTSLGNFMPLNSTLTQAAGGTLTFNGSGYIIMTGTNGTFVNNGTVTQATSGANNWYWRGTNVNFQNNNLLQLTGGSTWQMDVGSSVLTNAGTGTIDVLTNNATILGNDTDRYVSNAGLIRTTSKTLNMNARVDNTGTIRALNAGGLILLNNQTNNSGSIQASSGGEVRMQGALVDTGGTFSADNGSLIRFNGTAAGGFTTAASTQFNTTGTGEIRLGGRINALRGSWSGNVYLQEAFATGQATSYIDLSGGTLVWKGVNASHTLNAGQVLEFRSPIQYNGTGGYSVMNGGGTLRNVSGNTFTLGNGNSIYLRNNGGFENYGTVNDNGGTSWQIDSVPALLSNYGTFTVSTANASINGNDVDRYIVNSGLMQASGSVFSSSARIDNTGTLRAQNSGGQFNISGQTNNTAQIEADNNGNLYLIGRLNDTGGTLSATNGGIIRFGIGTNGHTTSSSTTFTTDGTGEIRLGGKINSLEGSWSGNVYLQESLTPGQALSYIDLAGGTLTWKSGNISDNLIGGNVLEFRSPILFDGTTGYRVENGPGKLRNGVDNIFSQNGNSIYIRAAATFENAGEYHFINNVGHNLNLDSGVGTFRNLSTGTISVDAGSAFMNTTSASGTFDNQGTLVLQSGTTFTMNAAGTLPQYNGTNTLTGGTWKLLANSGQTTTLNLDPANAGITKIGAGAEVVIYEQDPTATANFAELGQIDNIAGKLYVHGTQVQTLAGTGVAVSGTLGGNGTYLAANGITFSGGELDPSNLAGLGGTMSILGGLSLSPTTTLSFTLAQPGIGGLNDLVTVNGDLVLDGVLDINSIGPMVDGRYRLFNFSGSITDNGLTFLQYNPRFHVFVNQLEGFVELVVTPEPSSSSLLLLGALGLVGRRRRRR